MTPRILLAFALFANLAAQEPWHAREAVSSILFNDDALRDLNLRVTGLERTGVPFRQEYVGFAAGPIAPTYFYAPNGDFEQLAAGAIEHQGGFILQHGDHVIDLLRFQLRTAPDPFAFSLTDLQGRTWFHVQHVHSYLYPTLNELRLLNMDLVIAPQLAALLNRPDLIGMYLGTIDVVMAVDAPDGFQPGAPCTANFTGDVDVELTQLSGLSQLAREAGVRVALAPSARLRNAGTADVPWYRAILPDGNGGPSIIGQHPFLVLHFYRAVDGAFEMLGQSDVKHAFYSINSGCSCNGGQILYVGCADVYGAGTNASRFYLAPRDELDAFTGAWQSMGSHFDAVPVDDFRHHNSSGHDSFEHRLTVSEAKMQTPGARYFVEGWYLVKDDIDIYNSMGYREVIPSLSGSAWSFAYPALSHTPGPAIDAWIPRGLQSQLRSHTAIDSGEGRFHLAVTAHMLPNGRYRYEYALMNLDFDRQIRELSIPVPAAANVDNTGAGSLDGGAANNWPATVGGGSVAWTAPEGEGLDWGTMYQFRFDADFAPVDATATLLPREAGKADQFSAATKAPSAACATSAQVQSAISQWPAANTMQELAELINAECRP